MTSSRKCFRPIAGLLFLSVAAFAAGCSSANTTGGNASVNHLTSSGASIPGWISASGSSLHSRTATNAFIQEGNNGACTECHGGDLLGGISRTSCMDNPAACHHGTIDNWVVAPAGTAAQQHGAAAKRGPGSSSLYACQICHGADFRTVRAGGTCFDCHTAAPHPNRPWRSGGTDNTHVNTNTANAPVCYGCHADSAGGNASNPHRPPQPAASGSAPGCFNGTMCHNQSGAPHAVGAAWLTAGTGFHGTDAKADLTFCQGCHGAPGTINFNGGSAPTSCSASACHPAAKAHPTDWQGIRTINGATITHRTSGNRAVACAICHRVDAAGAGPNPSAPSCFSAAFTNAGGQNRSCHPGGPGTAPHALGSTWLDPAAGGAAFHGTSAKADLLFCRTCHGTPPRGFAGGTGATTVCTACHTTAEAHPTDWQGIRAISTASISHRTSGNRTAACGICHNVTAAGAGPHPSAPSCFSASYTNGSPGAQSRPCHSSGPGQPNHTVPFTGTAHTQATSATFTANCQTCHDVSGTTTKVGPVCQTCHTGGSPLTALSCTSCHGNPPTGGTTAYPNVAGAHAKHMALNNSASPGTPVSCATCHTGLGSGTQSHYDRSRPGPSHVSPASVAFAATYNAKTGASAFDNSALLRCANVSCHGGQATPNWQTGTLTVNTQCTSCHTLGTAQFNSYNSGQHSRSEHSSRACTVCHNTATLAPNHFNQLNSPAMEGPASATIGGGSTNIAAGNYNAATRSCTPTCHGNQTW